MCKEGAHVLLTLLLHILGALLIIEFSRLHRLELIRLNRTCHIFIQRLYLFRKCQYTFIGS